MCACWYYRMYVKCSVNFVQDKLPFSCDYNCAVHAGSLGCVNKTSMKNSLSIEAAECVLAIASRGGLDSHLQENQQH